MSDGSELSYGAGIAARASLVIETHNLRALGRHGSERRMGSVVGHLAALLGALAAQGRAFQNLREVIVTHDGLPAAEQAELRAAAGRALDFLALPDGTGYYGAKTLGFARCTGAVVVFTDGDCLPADGWLDALLRPFADTPAAQVVAGRTRYPDGVRGDAATACDFLYVFADRARPRRRVTNFYANNVAFSRAVFAAHSFPEHAGFEHGHCQLLALALEAADIAIHWAPQALCRHRLPKRGREWRRLRVQKGLDVIGAAPLVLAAKAPWLPRFAYPLMPPLLLAGRLLWSEWTLLSGADRAEAGAASTHRQTLLRLPAAMALAAGLTAVDFAGVLLSYGRMLVQRVR